MGVSDCSLVRARTNSLRESMKTSKTVFIIFDLEGRKATNSEARSITVGVYQDAG